MKNQLAVDSYISFPIDDDLSGQPLYRAIAAHWRVVLCAWLGFWVLATVLSSLHWQQVNDPAQLQYASFLVDHGMSPYHDLIEMNMPGVYLTNWAVMHTLGAGSLAWRLFDLGLMVMAGLAMISIARPYDWFAGALAASMFFLFHARDGAMQMGQRDLIIAVMLVCAYAFLFRALRTGSTWLMVGFGMALGFAVTFKPTPAPFVFLLLGLAALRFRSCGARWIRATLLGICGVIVPIGIVVAFLSAKNALADFLWVVRWTLPYYSTLARLGWVNLLCKISPSIWEIAFLAGVISVLTWRENLIALGRRSLEAPVADRAADVKRWETWMLALGALFGVASYLGQDKGMVYHRYPFIAFALLCSAICIVRALRRPGIIRALAAAGVAFALILAVCYAHESERARWSTLYIDALTADLNRLGGPALDRRVQCLTTQADCATTLYRMNLVQSTGLFYDFLIFGPGSNPAVQHWRTRFQEELDANPPDVFVVHRGQYPNDDGYIKLSRWPEFGDYIERNYILYSDRTFPPSHGNIMAYRIYVRRDLGDIARR